jgi:hypothetical protein
MVTPAFILKIHRPRSTGHSASEDGTWSQPDIVTNTLISLFIFRNFVNRTPSHRTHPSPPRGRSPGQI